MIRFVSVVFALFLMVCLCFGYQKDTLVLYAKNVDDEVEIIDSFNDYELIKINREKLEKFINRLSLNIISKNTISDSLIIEGYTAKLNNYVVSNNTKINVQISIVDNVCLVGYPLIKKSF